MSIKDTIPALLIVALFAGLAYAIWKVARAGRRKPHQDFRRREDDRPIDPPSPDRTP